MFVRAQSTLANAQLQWYREPSRCYPTRKRSQNMTNMEAIRMLDSSRPAVVVRRRSATLRARKAAGRAPCSRRRYRPRRCSDSSSAAAGPLADHSVCRKEPNCVISGCKSSWREIEYELISAQHRRWHLRHRPRLRLQPRRWPWHPRPPVWRRSPAETT